ncbi:MAG TPA: hypothetical protein VG838_08405 [Opitutaceae bacterium]|nr:hypothetical protein [Opitutaceae bacterium]
MSAGDDSNFPTGAGDVKKNVLLSVFVETFDVYVRGTMEIAAELGLSNEITVEGLMAYWLSLPEADNLVRDFIRGDLTMFSLADRTRQMVESDLGRLEIEPADLVSMGAPTTRLGKKLDAMRREEAGERVVRGKASDLENFIHDNPEILKQVAGSSHEILVMWVMLYLMHATKARERGHRVASEFVKQHPEVRERIRAVVARQSQQTRQRSQRQVQGQKISSV